MNVEQGLNLGANCRVRTAGAVEVVLPGRPLEADGVLKDLLRPDGH
jgi:hypothetical protein